MASAAALVMAKVHTVMFAWLCGSACVDSDELVTADRTLGDDARASAIRAMASPDEPDICELLPDCGPCSVACDPGALAEYAPAGTCAAFLCELDDGRMLTFHACHYE